MCYWGGVVRTEWAAAEPFVAFPLWCGAFYRYCCGFKYLKASGINILGKW